MNISKYINKIIIGVALLALLFVATIGYLLVAQLDLEVQQERTRANNTLSNKVTQELRQTSEDLSSAGRAYVLTGDPRYKAYYNEIRDIRDGKKARPVDYDNTYWAFVFDNGKKPRADTATLIPLTELAKKVGFTKKELELVKSSRDESNKLIKIENQAFNASIGLFLAEDGNYAKLGVPDKKAATELLFSKEYFSEKAKIMKPLSELYDTVRKRTATAVDAINNKLSADQSAINLIAVLLLLLLIVLGYLVYKRSLILLEARQKAQKKAEDENDALNDSVINILEAVNSLSQRDLTAKAPVTEDIIGTVSDSINALTDETATVLHNVTDIANQVSSVSDNVRLQAAQVSETAKEEQESVQKMFESLFEATQTMNQVAALSEQSNESAEQATKVTANALETVNSTVEGMESIRETISETEKRIKRLGERSQEISGIVNLINTISERTHVLALNASMQAAVAGEAGRGFAVVAEEVQQLAESSRNATEQISTLVNNIQIETNETINTVNKTIGQVVEGSEQAQQAGAQMRETQKITSELVSRVQSIAKASDKQKEMSAQLLQAVQDIGESNEKTAEQIETQNIGTQELQEAAKTLVSSVNVFTLPQRS